IKNLYPLLHRVHHPNVAIAIDGNAFGPRELPGAIAVLSKRPDEFSVRIEDLNPIVQGVRDEDVALFIDRHVRRQSEIPRVSQQVFLSRCPDLPQQLVTVRIEHIHNVAARVHHIQKAVLLIDGHSAGTHQHVRAKGRFLLVLRVDDNHLVEFVVRHEQLVVVVDHQTIDQTKMRFLSVADHFYFEFFVRVRIEDEDRSYCLVSRVNISLRIKCQSVSSKQLEGQILNRICLRLRTYQTVHPALLWLFRFVDWGAKVDLLACELLHELDPYDLGRVRPYNFADIKVHSFLEARI